GQKVDDIPVNLPVPEQSSAQLDVELNKIGIEKDDTVIMMHPTFSGYSKLGLRKREARKRKLWPAQNYADLAKRLLQSDYTKNHRVKIIMALLPAEQFLGKKIVKLSDGKVQLIESVPSFERYKALIHRADLFVSPDTGPMHIAAAVNTRTVVMFSNKDPADCGPYMPSDRFNILRSECTDHPEKGIAAITVDAMMLACDGQLEKIESEKAGKVD
ncbi:MAG: glycosyltransferase family 9 protein, partial [Gammaproteobacteria bacterium]|nr:glycosyltransferase family 9 protein [Gammaproteobacteria bacterium]